MATRILVISNYRDYHTTRPEAETFIGLAQLGFEIYVMTYPDTPFKSAFAEAGIRVIDFHPTRKFNRTEIDKIRQTIVDYQIDILHLFNSVAIYNGIQSAKKQHVKVVLYRGYCGNIHWYDPSAYLKYLHPRVDKIVCNSIGVEQEIQRQFFFKTNKTVTINKGHDLAWYSSYAPTDIRAELGIPQTSFLFVVVGNNRKMKGIVYLAKAFAQIPHDLPVHLLLIGRDMNNAEINQALHGRSNVHFLGFRKDVLHIVAACQVFVLPSIFGESITKSVIEAMSLGIAPIITDIEGNVELVENGQSGFVVPAKNSDALSQAMLELYQNPEKLKMMGEAAKRRITTHLNIQQTIIATKKLYDELMLSK